MEETALLWALLSLCMILGGGIALVIGAVWASGEVSQKLSFWLFLGPVSAGGIVEYLRQGTVSDIVGAAIFGGLLGMVALIFAAIIKKRRERRSVLS